MKKYKKLFIILAIIILVPIVLLGILRFALKDVGIYYEDDLIIQSPNEDGFLIIREFSALGGSGSIVYYVKGKKDWWFNKTKIGFTGADDYRLPFSDGQYIIDWHDGSVEIRYYSGVEVEDYDDPDTWCVQRFELP